MLEKILQEIEAEALQAAVDDEPFVMLDDVERIIRSHMESELIAACHCKDCANKELIGSGGHVYCRKTNTWRDADDFCKHAKRSDKEDAQMS